MSNPFNLGPTSLQGPATDILPVTPSDANDLTADSGQPVVAVSLFIETAGDVVVVTERGNTRTVAVPDAFTLLVGVRRVMATGTTATGIHAYVVTR